MGNQQSAEKGQGQPIKKEQRPSRKPSVQLPRKAIAADLSASNASATAQVVPQAAQKPAAQQHLRVAQSPEVVSKAPGGIGRSDSKGSSNNKEKNVFHHSREEAAPELSPAGPVDVPIMSKGKQDDFQDPLLSAQRYVPVSHTRPPRLPLPIVHDPMPDSPTLTPLKIGHEDVTLFANDRTENMNGPALHRQNSMLSTVTEDEYEVGGELEPYAMETTAGQTVGVRVEWPHGGDTVYVTGTPMNWERKFRLHKR